MTTTTHSINYTTHILARIFHQGGSRLVVPGISKWEIPEKNNFEWHHSFYRYWLTSNGTIYNMHTFPKVPWFKTVIGFEDDASRAFLLKFLIAVYQVEKGG